MPEVQSLVNAAAAHQFNSREAAAQTRVLAKSAKAGYVIGVPIDPDDGCHGGPRFAAYFGASTGRLTRNS